MRRITFTNNLYSKIQCNFRKIKLYRIFDLLNKIKRFLLIHSKRQMLPKMKAKCLKRTTQFQKYTNYSSSLVFFRNYCKVHQFGHGGAICRLLTISENHYYGVLPIKWGVE